MRFGRSVLFAFTALFAFGCTGGRAMAFSDRAPIPALSPPPFAGYVSKAERSGPVVPSGATAVAFAQARLGVPYCWGGVGPNCYDCSGLVYAAWRAAGRSIPRSSAEQGTELTPVPMNQLKPGDILWRPGHVGLYAGSGWVIAAPKRGDVIRYQPLSMYVRAVRP